MERKRRERQVAYEEVGLILNMLYCAITPDYCATHVPIIWGNVGILRIMRDIFAQYC